MITPLRKTVNEIAIHTPSSPKIGVNIALKGIRSILNGKPTTAGGTVSPAPENAPLRITSAAEKIKTAAATLLYVEAALITEWSSEKIELFLR